MKNNLFFVFAIFFATLFSTQAQTGVHIQEGATTGIWIHNKDSVYVAAGANTFNHVALLNPSTKDWKYLNSNMGDYHQYMGFFVMKNTMEGVMSYPYNPNKVYKTTDGWKTITVVDSAPTINQLVLTAAGYVGFNKTFKNLYFSSDGLSWKSVASGGATDISPLRAYKDKVILYSGSESGSFVSTDGGQSFSYENINMSFPGKLLSFEMFSEDTFIVVTETNLYKTFDGGATKWTSNTLPFVSASNAVVKNMNEIYVGQSKGFFSSDGGVTWLDKKGFAPSNPVYIDNELYDWPGSVSDDNGDTWHDFLPLFPTNNYNDVSFNGSKGILASNNGRVIVSLDKGRSFSSDILLPTNQAVKAVKVLDNGDILADAAGKLFYSTDNGLTWTPNATGTSGYKFCTAANDSVILYGGFTPNPLVSNNHGKTFTSVFVKGGSHTQTIKPNGNVIDVTGWFDYTTFSDKGWMISRWTIDGNQTVLDTFLTTNESPVDIHNATDNIGYFITSDKKTLETIIYKTTSGWSSGGTAIISRIASVKTGVTNYENNAFVNRKMTIQTFGADTVILSGTGNTFYHASYNGGLTWNIDSTDVHVSYPQIYPSMRRAYFFNSKEFVYTLNNSGVYINVNSSGITTGINELTQNQISMPQSYELFQNYPNPFNPTTNFEFSIAAAGMVTLKIYDILGKEVATVVNDQLMAGNYHYHWDAKKLASGVYLYRLTSNNYSAAKKFVLLK